jgi:hypothetical protein
VPLFSPCPTCISSCLGWIVLDILFVEVPVFQQTQPEGLKIAADMTLAGAIALTTMVPGCLIMKYYLRLCDQTVVLVLILLEVTTALFAALLWPVAIGGFSIAIHSSIFMASGLGSLQTVVVLPWLSEHFTPEVISPVMTGSNFGSLMGAVVGLLQRPGLSNQLFGPTVYFFCFAAMMAPSIFAFRYVVMGGIEMKGAGMQATQLQLQSPTDHRRHQHSFSQSINLDRVIRKPSPTGPTTDESSLTSATPPSPPPAFGKMDIGDDEDDEERNDGGVADDTGLCGLFVASKEYFSTPPANWRRAIPLCLLNSYLQLMCWSFLRAILPFASYHTASSTEQHRAGSGAGASVTMYSIELSYFAVTLGALLSSLTPCSKWRWQMRVLTLTFTLTMLVFFLAAADQPFLPGLRWNSGAGEGKSARTKATSGAGGGAHNRTHNHTHTHAPTVFSVDQCPVTACCVVIFKGAAGEQCGPVSVWDMKEWVHPGLRLGARVVPTSLCGSKRYDWLAKSHSHVHAMVDPEDVTMTRLVGGGIRVGLYSDTHPLCAGAGGVDAGDADSAASASSGNSVSVGSDDDNYIWGWGAGSVVAVVFFLRLLDGYISPLIFRRIALEFPNSGEITRWVALVEKATTFITAWVAFGLVESGVIGA